MEQAWVAGITVALGVSARPFPSSPFNLILCCIEIVKLEILVVFEIVFVLLFYLCPFFSTLKSLLQVDRHTVFSIITNFMRSREEGEESEKQAIAADPTPH